jgi:hypothetical protein
MLGLLDARHTADKIWEFYQQVRNNTEENLFVGALWGLIDLEDPRAADALLDLLLEDRNFHELFGFLSLAADHRAVLPLLFLSMKGDEDIRGDAAWALAVIGHRIGRKALLESMISESELSDSTLEKRTAIADHILSPSEEDAKNYFSLFHEKDMSSAEETIMASPLLH